ncbi:uncharacterized protein LTR77_010968 [Saxophila tyrrhenica]|uniref:Cytochrome P450 n=1 Tax=Saxophila tyrrhenica TaxID=1690608 RepID=A0AAV9NTS6_9PEZI|nr:hypothetical protein LTR77_010968 [Saxophila tyrrhenica]
MTYGTLHRSARCAVDTAIVYDGWVIPAGTAVSISSHCLHTDASVFSQPHLFQPERWLEGCTREMHLSLRPWSAGSRDCPGQRLAKGAIVKILAEMFGPNMPCMAPFATTVSDVMPKFDYLVPMRKFNSHGLRVKIV